MNLNKIIIYLAELAHDGFGLSLNTIPLGIGKVGAYTKKIFDDAVEIRLFRRVGDLSEAIRSKKPHIVGFGYYSWNDNLTLAAVSQIKEMNPEILTVVGGPNISSTGWENTGDLSQKNPELKRVKQCALHASKYDYILLNDNRKIDVIVHGDGEIPFANIVRKYLGCFDSIKTKSEPADGCSSLVDGKLIAGNPVKLLSDLDSIPSPYLMGLYDELLEEFNLMPQLETVRGCPYECTYCTIGGNINKLRKHSFERITDEILYIKDHSSYKIIRIADSNWGILKSDIKLAEFIKKLNHEQGYPTSLRVYYAERGPYANIRTMAETLKKFLPLNMSLQTLTPDVLKEIKRKNMPHLNIMEMVSFAHENNIFVSTELIFGLPGETCNSFRKVFDDVVKLNFDSIYVGSLYLIKGSELYTDVARDKYNFKTMYTLIGKDVTLFNSSYIFEVDEVVVESNSMSRDDFWELEKLKLFIFLCYGAAFLKEIIMHCMNYSVTVLDIYDELTEKTSKYPYFNMILTDYIDNIKSKYFNTIEDLRKELVRSITNFGNIDNFSRIRLLLYYVGKTLSGAEKKRFISEFITAAKSKYQQTVMEDAKEEFYIQLSLLGDYASKIIISPAEELEEEVLYECHYDIAAWTKDGFVKPLSDYYYEEAKRFSLWVRNINEQREIRDRTASMTDIDKYQFYFTTVVSSNMRRYITYSTN